MAKKAVTASEAPLDPEGKYSTTKVEAAIRKIEEAYRLGRKSIAKHGESLYSKPTKIIPAFAAGMGYQRDAVERARQFARMFQPQMVDQICRECRKYDFPLGVTLIYRVLPLGDSPKCMQVLRRAIREGWTLQRLGAVVSVRTGATPRKGRQRILPTDSNEACQQFDSRMQPVIRWLEEVKSVSEGALADDLVSRIDLTIAKLRDLKKQKRAGRST